MTRVVIVADGLRINPVASSSTGPDTTLWIHGRNPPTTCEVKLSDQGSRQLALDLLETIGGSLSQSAMFDLVADIRRALNTSIHIELYSPDHKPEPGPWRGERP